MLGNLKLQVLSSICQIIDTALDLEKALAEVLRILSETLSMSEAVEAVSGLRDEAENLLALMRELENG